MDAIISIIWGAIEDAAIEALQIAVLVIHWAVIALWAAVTTLGNGLILVGSRLLDGFQKVWAFTKGLYDDVLQPAWAKLSDLFSRVRDWLNDTFGPIIDALKSVRKTILDFYADWIRPILDVIDATRAILKVLEALHIAWAQALDNALGTAEDWVNSAFQLVLSKLNGVINVINSVVTGDLLFQRLPFLKTLERDVLYAHRVLTNARKRKNTSDEDAAIARAAETRSQPEVVDDTIAYFEGGDSEIVGPLVGVAADEWATLLGLDKTTGEVA
jgi:phage-related protein